MNDLYSRISELPLRVDFAGTGSAVSGNLNAPRAVVQAAVLYVLRALVDERIPLNGGCLEPVELRIPEGSLLDPPAGSAVVGLKSGAYAAGSNVIRVGLVGCGGRGTGAAKDALSADHRLGWRQDAIDAYAKRIGADVFDGTVRLGQVLKAL